MTAGRYYLTGSKKRTVFAGDRVDIWQAQPVVWDTGSNHPTWRKVARRWDEYTGPQPVFVCIGSFANRDWVYCLDYMQNHIDYSGFYPSQHHFAGRWLAKERVIERWFLADFLTDPVKVREAAAQYRERVRIQEDRFGVKSRIWFRDENELVFAKMLYT